MKQRTSPLLRATTRRLRLRPVAFSLLCAGAVPAMAQVLPTGFLPSALPGNVVSMTQAGNIMSIVQGSQRGIVNWTTFSIGAKNIVNIQQPNLSLIHI